MQCNACCFAQLDIGIPPLGTREGLLMAVANLVNFTGQLPPPGILMHHQRPVSLPALGQPRPYGSAPVTALLREMEGPGGENLADTSGGVLRAVEHRQRLLQHLEEAHTRAARRAAYGPAGPHTKIIVVHICDADSILSHELEDLTNYILLTTCINNTSCSLSLCHRKALRRLHAPYSSYRNSPKPVLQAGRTCKP